MDFRNDVAYRKESLKKLLHSILKNEQLIVQALYDDFRKSEFESVLTETHFVISELENAIKTINKRTRPKRVLPSLLNFPSTDYIHSEPYGAVLIIAPWNYPFHLAMCPVIAAVAAGNSVVLKPSELTPNTSSVIAQIIAETFEPGHVQVVQGGPDIAQNLLKQRWDYIFFTGSVAVGKLVAKAAAENLTPVTLELGGKNPCIVDETSDLQLAAKRIVWGKFINAGQTCIAPDYILANEKIFPSLIENLKREIIVAYGENQEESPDFPRIVNAKNFERLRAMLLSGDTFYGGQINEQTNYIAPTILTNPDPESELMQSEIFGPLLPVLSWRTIDEISEQIQRFEKPLSLYVFSNDKKFARTMIADYAFGGGCINDTVIHFGNSRLPFGGVGHSGMGAYHGQRSFDTFSHKKSVVQKANWLDLPFRYAPYRGKINFIRKVLRWF